MAPYSSKYAEPYVYATASTSTSNPPPPGNMSGHYEVDEDYGDPYWDPSSMEDELRMQLQKLKVQEIPREDLQWVFVNSPCNLGSTVDNNGRPLELVQLIIHIGSYRYGQEQIVGVC